MSMMSELSADTDELIADFNSNDNGDYSMEQLNSYDKRLKSILQVCETVYKGFGYLYNYFKLRLVLHSTRGGSYRFSCIHPKIQTNQCQIF